MLKLLKVCVFPPQLLISYKCVYDFDWGWVNQSTPSEIHSLGKQSINQTKNIGYEEGGVPIGKSKILPLLIGLKVLKVWGFVLIEKFY